MSLFLPCSLQLLCECAEIRCRNFNTYVLSRLRVEHALLLDVRVEAPLGRTQRVTTLVSRGTFLAGHRTYASHRAERMYRNCRDWSILTLLIWHKPQSRSIDAVALSCGVWPVVKDVAKMASVLRFHLRSLHAPRVIFLQHDGTLLDRLKETGPTCTRFKLRIGMKKWFARVGRDVGSLSFLTVERTGEGLLGSRFVQDALLFIGEWKAATAGSARRRMCVHRRSGGKWLLSTRRKQQERKECKKQ